MNFEVDILRMQQMPHGPQMNIFHSSKGSKQLLLSSDNLWLPAKIDANFSDRLWMEGKTDVVDEIVI